QRAQPISAGAEALAWAQMLDRDRERISVQCGDDPPLTTFGYIHRDSPLGAGAIAGTSLPIDPKFTADTLKHGFFGGPLSSIESTASRDRACDFVFGLAMISQHLSRWAEQWIIYMSQEFGFIKIA